MYVQLIHFAEQQKLTQHCKVNIPQLKKKKRSESVQCKSRIWKVCKCVAQIFLQANRPRSILATVPKGLRSTETEDTFSMGSFS